jgi:Cytochrome c3
MSFIVRQLSTTSDGREIVRSGTYDSATLNVGRDSANEIHLPDLAVDLLHARISRTESGRVRVESVGTLGFEADGRSVMNAEFSPDVGAELRFGGHRLTISSDGGNAVITVKRTEAIAESTIEREEAGLFTLAHVMPGRRIMAWGFIAAMLALCLIWPIMSFMDTKGIKTREAGFHADTMWTSGDLSLAHQSLKDNCQACHVKKFEAVQDKSCLTCHKDDAHDHAPAARISRSMEAPGMGGSIKNWFKTSFGKPLSGCVDCHTEHEGAGDMPRTAQAFCTDCHSTLNKRLTDTKLPNAADFGTDHPQFRPHLTVNPGAPERQTQRFTLAASTTEDNGLKFPHDSHLSKTNGIARMVRTMKGEQGWGDQLACKDCHTPSADGTRFQPVSMEQNCQSCHSLAFDRIGGTFRTLRHGEPAQVAADIRAFYRSTGPLRPINLSSMSRRRPGESAEIETAVDYNVGTRAWSGGAEEAVRAVFSKGGACYDCHTITPTNAGWNVMKVYQPARYMQKGWFDHNAHKQEDCASCHKADGSKVATDLLIPDLASCRTCHVGEGGASLAKVKAPVESSCAMCHDYHIDEGAPWSVKRALEKGKGTRSDGQKISSAR